MNQGTLNRPLPPSEQQMELIRIYLSIYQYGMGGIPLSSGKTLPGWRDFSHVVAAVFGGENQESRSVFDVLVPDTANHGVHYGICCRMKRELGRISAMDGRVSIELTNSASQIWKHLHKEGINEANFRDNPAKTGEQLLEFVERWYEAAMGSANKKIDRSKSFFLILSWHTNGQYQLHQFPLHIPQNLRWYIPTVLTKHGEKLANRLCGADDTGVVIEWFGGSGEQLKYYPLSKTALWASDVFRLESSPTFYEKQNVRAQKLVLDFVGKVALPGFRAIAFNKLLLVEGRTDVRTIQEFLRLYGKDHEILILPLGGSTLIHGQAETELQQFTRIADHVFALIDSERLSAHLPPRPNRVEFQALCKKLGIYCHILERRATENYLSERVINHLLGVRYHAPKPFERLRDLAPTWDKEENWRIAHEMTLEDLEGTDLGAFLKSLCWLLCHPARHREVQRTHHPIFSNS